MLPFINKLWEALQHAIETMGMAGASVTVMLAAVLYLSFWHRR